MAEKKEPPEYILWIVDKNNTHNKTRAGALFKHDFGFHMVLNPGVVLDYKMLENFWLSFKENKPSDPPWKKKKDVAEDEGTDQVGDDVPIK